MGCRSTALGLDADLRPLWTDRADHLAPFPTASVRDPAQPVGSAANITVFTAQEYPSYV